MASYADEVAALRGTRSATLKDLLKHPPFARLLAAMSVSSLGDWVGFTAVLALVTRVSASTAAALGAVAAVMTARMLPAVLFGPFAGALVDRMDRKRIMIAADLGRGAMYASMTIPLLQKLWIIFPLSFAIECLSLLWTPARDASLPNLVPRRQLANANSVGLITTYGTLPIGGLVAIVLAAFSKSLGARIGYFATHTESAALWLDAATFVFSALMVSHIPIKVPASRIAVKLDLRRVGRDIVDGVKFLREHSLTSTMTTGIVAAFAATGAVLSLGPTFAAKTLGAPTAGWPILMSAFGVGMAGGMITINVVSRVVERELVFSTSMLAASGTLFVLAAMPNISMAALFTVVLGYFCGTMWVTGYVMLQENVADEYRGRTFGSLTVVARLGLFLSLTLFPTLAIAYGNHAFMAGGQRVDLSGTRLALMTAGIGVTLAGIFTRNGLRRLRLSRPKPLGLVPKLKRPPQRGLFVVFEGVEGAGKGTQIRLAKEFLESEGCEVLVTREPGGTDLGERLRAMLLGHETGHVEPRTEALLFAASRAQHVATVIRPALAEGKVVVCDRYIDSSLAYQGWARGLGEQDVLTLNVWATQGLFPDLVILLHLEPEAGLLRSLEEPDRIEMEGGDFHAKVSDAYLKIAEEHPERFVVIDASEAPEKVHEKARESLARLLREREEDGGSGE
ncbi:MAG: dTMP kinase [Actinobacteria bacterium]|nr:dTMP kinase [Actinomycetota bacterium]